MIEQAANLGFRIGDNVFILDMQDMSREDVLPVPHQTNIVSVVAPNICQIISEMLALGEELLVAAEAAGQGMSSCIDDGRIWQDQADQANMGEIVRHLVDEEGRIGAMNAGALDVFFAERSEV